MATSAAALSTLLTLGHESRALPALLWRSGPGVVGPPVRRRRHVAPAAQEASKDKAADARSADEVTEKYGLEAGLWKIFNSKEEEAEEVAKDGEKKSKADQAKELLTKYGGAYLATSITLSAISFSLCYILVTAGVDVSALLARIGITTDATGEKVGALALAYAAHKAASPIRFPPTVALTPVVAGWLGKLRRDGQQ